MSIKFSNLLKSRENTQGVNLGLYGVLCNENMNTQYCLVARNSSCVIEMVALLL